MLRHFFEQQDNRPPHSAQAMTVRRTATRKIGPYTLLLSSSCGVRDGGTGSHRTVSNVIPGAMKLELWFGREEAPRYTKRCQVDSWRDCEDELERAVALLRR